MACVKCEALVDLLADTDTILDFSFAQINLNEHISSQLPTQVKLEAPPNH
jgi:hypothetical protein